MATENLHVSGKIWIRYGNYLHDPGEVEYSISSEALLTDAQTPYAEKVRVNLNGRLVGSSTTDIEKKVVALLTAYATPGLDFSIYLGPSATSVLSIDSSDTNGGVKILQPPSFPSNRNAAHVTFLDYTIALEAEVRLSNVATYLRSFSESVTRGGGSPAYVMLQPRRGRAQRQLGTRQPFYTATQQGTAVGLYAKPSPSPPLWPFALKEGGEFGETGGRAIGSTTMDKSTSWKYVYESTTPLFGSPRSWGVG